MKRLLLFLGLPLWLPILVACLAIITGIIVALWAGVISLWASFAVAVVCAPTGIVAGILNIINDSVLYGAIVIAMGICSAFLAFILFYISRFATKGALVITEKSWDALGSRNA